MSNRVSYDYQNWVGRRDEGSMASRLRGVNHEVRYTFDEAFDIFIRAKEAQGLRPRTISDYHTQFGYLTAYLDEHQSDLLYISDFTAAHIREYLRYLLKEHVKYANDPARRSQQRGLSPVTVNIRLKSLKSLCKFLYDEKLLPDNPSANVKKVSENIVEEVAGFSNAEISAILKAIDVKQFAGFRDRILVYLYLDTGLRVNEAITLKKSAINFDTRTLKIEADVEKTRRERFVPVSKVVLNMLRQLIVETERYFGDCEYVFMNAFGESLQASTIRRRLNGIARKLRMKNVAPGRFRHTFARNYLLNGGDLVTLSVIMGHSNISTTRKYVQLDMADLQKQHDTYSPLKNFYKQNRIGKRK